MSCRFMWGWRAMVPLCVHLVHLVAVVYHEPRPGRFYSILFYSGMPGSRPQYDSIYLVVHSCCTDKIQSVLPNLLVPAANTNLWQPGQRHA